MGFNMGQFVTLVQTHAINVDIERNAGVSKIDALECKAVGAVALAMQIKEVVRKEVKMPERPIEMVKWVKELVAFQYSGDVPEWLSLDNLKKVISEKKEVKA